MRVERTDQRFFGFHRNIFFLDLVSLFTNVSSEMIYPLLPIFLTSVPGVGAALVGLVEGVAEVTASFLKLFSRWTSDRRQRRKPLVTFGYTLSILAPSPRGHRYPRMACPLYPLTRQVAPL